MKSFKFIAAFTCLLFSATTIFAQQGTTARQHSRIKQGVRSGELTRAETYNLAKQQRETRRDVRDAKADGVVTGRERRCIKKDKIQSSQSIYRKKHNDRDRN